MTVNEVCGWAVLAPPAAGDFAARDTPPTFSVIVAAHDAEPVIRRSVESALNQTVPPLEVVVCDDGPSDELVEILRPYDRVQVVRQQNSGPAAARNRAAASATGDFLVVLDADDAFHPRRLEAIGELLRLRPDLDLVATDARLIKDGVESGRFYDSNSFEVDDQRRAILRSCFVGGWPAIRRSLFAEVGGYDEELWRGEDWNLFVRMILHGATAGLVGGPLLDYTIGAASLTADRRKSLQARIVVMDKALRDPALRRDEREVARGTKRAVRRRLARLELDEAVLAGDRAAIVRSAFRRHATLRTRLRALGALGPFS